MLVPFTPIFVRPESAITAVIPPGVRTMLPPALPEDPPPVKFMLPPLPIVVVAVPPTKLMFPPAPVVDIFAAPPVTVIDPPFALEELPPVTEMDPPFVVEELPLDMETALLRASPLTVN